MCYPASVTPYGCINSCGISFPTSSSRRTDELTIHIPHNQYSSLKDIDLVKESSQRIFQKLKTELADSSWVPQKASRFTQLIYYAGLSNEQSPYSEHDYIIMRRAHSSDLSTKRWLQVGFVSALAAPIVLWSLASENPWIVAAAITVSIATNAISWISTGSNPDFKSDSANARQDILQKLSCSFEMLSAELIDMNLFHSSLAQEIATSLDISKILKKMHEQDPANKESTQILKSLDAARCYVLGIPIPEDAPLSIRCYIKAAQLHLAPRTLATGDEKNS